MKKRKIAIDARMYGAEFTGIGNYIQEICTRLFDTLPKTQFILFIPKKTAKKIHFPKNVKVIIADEPIYSWAEQIHFCKKINAVKANITWFPHFNVPLFFRGNFVTTVHDLTIVKYPGKKMRRFWHRIAYFSVLQRALRRAKKIITVSQYTKKEIKKFANIHSKKIKVIWNGIDTKRFGKANEKKKKEYKEIFGNIFFLISGVWREHKNIPEAIRAFEMYKNSGGKGSLVITGKPDPFYPEVQNLVKKSKWKKEIFLTGFVDDKDIPALFAAATVFIFPSLAEGFGLPALEAMASETPVISSNRTCLPEVCGDAALYFNPENPEEMALKMVEAQRTKIQKDLIKKGKQRIEEFSWEKAAQEVQKILKKA